jgi:hypothetical protein
VEKLNQIGFVWEIYETLWEQGFRHLKAFTDNRGHCIVARDYVTNDGYKLGVWVSIQRKTRFKMSDEHVQRLNELGFVWDPLLKQWEDGFNHLKRFVKKEGHCLVPAKYKTESGFKLGSWVMNNRQNRDQVPEDRRRRLDEIGFVWSQLDQQWEGGYSHLKAFRDKEGHCQVPKKYKTEDGYNLGQWLQDQRKKFASLSGEKKAQLLDLGVLVKLATSPLSHGKK